MAEDHRSRDDRYGQAYQPSGQQQGGYGRDQDGPQDQNQYGQAGGYSQSFGPAQPAQGGYGGGYGAQNYAQGYDRPGFNPQGAGQPNYGGGPGGYGDNRWPGGSGGYAGYGPSHHGPQSGQAGTGGYGAQNYGQAYGQAGGQYGGPPRGFQQGDQGYTGQTGTGYGRTFGGEAYQPPEEGREGRSWWERTRDFLSGDERPGAHRGRGPKGYSRSDERILDDVNDRLTDDPFLDASDIEVTVVQGEVTLSGTVSSRADKRRAEDLADNVSGVKHLQNNLRVVSAASS